MAKGTGIVTLFLLCLQSRKFNISQLDNHTIGAVSFLYCWDRNLSTNTITVDTNPPQTKKDASITLDGVNWISGTPYQTEQLEAQFRYRQTPINVTLNNDTITPLTILDEPSAGQSVVFYNKEECLGGGIVVK